MLIKQYFALLRKSKGYPWLSKLSLWLWSYYGYQMKSKKKKKVTVGKGYRYSKQTLAIKKFVGI